MVRTVGVEEELLLVDAGTGAPRAVASAVLAGLADGTLDSEIQEQQMETRTEPHASLDELREDLRSCRTRAARSARAKGVEVAALATAPLPVSPTITPKGRYRRMAREFGLTAQEQLTCGCHIHVHVESDEEGVAVLDRLRPWLAPLLALSANSPLWQGLDSGYASYRYQVWGRWPSAGPADAFGSADGYHHAVAGMLSTGTLLDEGMVYFDARLSRTYPTVEVRICDVCPDVEDAVLLAALVRGLVETSARDWRAGRPAPRVGTSLLRLASWRASRSGLCGALLHPASHRPVAAREVVEALIEYTGQVLREQGDLETVRAGADRLLKHGTGARWQREVFGSGSAEDVVREAVLRTQR